MSQDWPSWLPLRGNLRELSAYGAPQLPADAVLNTNENPYAPSPELAQAIAARVLTIASTLNRYPDRDALALRTKLAEFVNNLSATSFTSRNIWAANGSNEIIQSLFLAFGGGSAIGFTPSYSMHPLIGLLVVDEAYAEFSDEASAITLIEKYPHVVVIRTMSKAFSFAGARVGYLVAHPSVIDAMFLVRLPYHLSALTQAAAEVALDFSTELLATVDQLRSARNQMAQELEELGLTVLPSSANFLLFTGFEQSSPELWQALLDRGVLIRDVGLLGYLRVTIGNVAENKKFIDSLSACLGVEI